MGHDVSKKHRQGHQQQYRPTQPSQPPRPMPRTEPATTKPNRPMPTKMYDLSQFAVVTVIFNPIQYASRYEHYNNFQKYIAQSGVALYTVECLFESAPQFGLPKQTFHVTQPNNPYHIRIVAPSILWIKENLINIAVHQLPQHIQYVAWIDADIEFDHPQWPDLTMDALQRYPIVQQFELSFFLGPNGKNQILRRDYSFGYSIRNNKIIDPTRYDQWYAHPGYAWAMRRSTYVEMGGLLDFCIIGSGDLHFAYALLGRIEETIRPRMHPDYRSLAIQWGSNLAQIANNGENVGYVPINLYHFWHGDRDRRHYVDRWTIIEKHQFSPCNDLEKQNGTGLIRFVEDSHYGRPNMDTRLKALERDIVAYFKSREEDSRQPKNPPRPAPVKTKPFVAPKTQPHRSGGIKSTGFVSKPFRGTHHYPVWTSGPFGTHVDDCNPYPDPCICPGHIHCPDNHACPCPPDHHHPHHHHDHHDNDQHYHHPDESHGWNPSDHHDQDHHYHHPDESHGWNPSDHHNDHHHHHDDSHGWGTSDHHHHHHTDDYSSGGGGYDYSSGGGGGYDYSSGGGGGYSTTDYGGPGSFY